MRLRPRLNLLRRGLSILGNRKWAQGAWESDGKLCIMAAINKAAGVTTVSAEERPRQFRKATLTLRERKAAIETIHEVLSEQHPEHFTPDACFSAKVSEIIRFNDGYACVNDVITAFEKGAVRLDERI